MKIKEVIILPIKCILKRKGIRIEKKAQKLNIQNPHLIGL